MPLRHGLHVMMVGVVRFSVPVLQHVLALMRVQFTPCWEVWNCGHRRQNANDRNHQDSKLKTHGFMVALQASTLGSDARFWTVSPHLTPATSTPNTRQARPIR